MRRSQSPSLTIVVVANNLQLLKLLDMALRLELGCEVLSFMSSRNAEETVGRVRPDLFIIDGRLTDCDAYELDTRLHSVSGRETVSVVFINVATDDKRKGLPYKSCILKDHWNIEELYALVKPLRVMSSASSDEQI